MATKKTTTKTTKTKAVVKKTLPKKTVKKTAKKQPLVYASNQKSFWVKDGKILNSLQALRDAFDEMEKEVYAYHVQEKKNDFATWVGTVLCDDKCAADLKKAKSLRSAKTAISKHLKKYEV